MSPFMLQPGGEISASVVAVGSNGNSAAAFSG